MQQWAIPEKKTGAGGGGEDLEDGYGMQFSEVSKKGISRS